MTEAYIFDAVRTPRGKGKKDGALYSVKPVQLVAGLLNALQVRNDLDTSQVDDIVLGCVTPVGDQGADIAKTAAMVADWDVSVAGVQDKLNVFIDNAGNLGFGDGSLCSTHILKFEKKNCPNLVLNEFFCMTLSTAIGLPTAEVAFRRFGSHPALIVKRFDRKYVSDDSKVLRRHVIDGCQALNSLCSVR